MARGSVAKKLKKGRGFVSIDFTGVDDKGGGVRVAPGEYAVKVKKVTLEKSQAGKPYLLFMVVGLNGPLKGRSLRHIASLQPHALFTLRNTLLALKMDVPRSKMKLEFRSLVGKIMGVTVDDDEYKGRVKSAIVDVFPISVKGGKMVKEALPVGDELDRDDDELEDDLTDLDDDLDDDDLDDDDDLEDDDEED